MMTERKQQSGAEDNAKAPTAKAAMRETRRAAAMRENLRRRKAQTAERAQAAATEKDER